MLLHSLSMLSALTRPNTSPPCPDCVCVVLTVVDLQILVKAEKCQAHSANFSWLCATGVSLSQGAPLLTRGTQYTHNPSQDDDDQLPSQPQLDLSVESTLP